LRWTEEAVSGELGGTASETSITQATPGLAMISERFANEMLPVDVSTPLGIDRAILLPLLLLRRILIGERCP